MAEFFESYGIWVIWIIFGLFFLVFLVTAPSHAVLLLPLLGLPLFWLLPLEYALPINIATWLASPFLYWVIRRAMKKPLAHDGFQSLVGIQAEVVSKSETGRSAKYLVRAQGELWSAHSGDTLQPGERVNIVAVKGIGVVIERAEPGPGHAETKLIEVQDNERHCH
jgi:membrane protein implicated in regulation of membrane protease activity